MFVCLEWKSVHKDLDLIFWGDVVHWTSTGSMRTGLISTGGTNLERVGMFCNPLVHKVMFLESISSMFYSFWDGRVEL